MLRHLTDYDVPSLERDLRSDGFVPSHARAILRTFYAADAKTTFDELSCSQRLRETLAQCIPLRSRVLTRHVSADGTLKLLIGFYAGGSVESVLMSSHRETIAA